MNNGKYHTKEYKQKLREATDRRYGEEKNHIKECVRCGTEYTIFGREKTKAVKNSRFCSRSCANNRQDYWNKNATNYRTICFQHHKKECSICGFDKIVVVHHMNEDHSDNRPENLVPLCPNHHEMFHSKYKEEVLQLLGH